MSIRAIYKHILLISYLLSQSSAFAGEIPNLAIRRFRAPVVFNGIRYTQRVKPGSPCDQILLAAQNRLGRELTDLEIRAEYPRLESEFCTSFKKTTGKELDLAFRHRALAWFTPIRTPAGFKLIQDFNIGDRVLTYDRDTHTVSSAEISDVMLFDYAPLDLYRSADSSLYLGRKIRLATGSLDEAFERPAEDTKWRRVLRAHMDGGSIQVRSSWNPSTVIKTKRVCQGMYLNISGYKPFFADDILVYSN